MSTNPPNDSSLQSTKQMLDELDALMDRMLALPVNEIEDAPAFPQEVVPATALAATLTQLQTPPPVPTLAPPIEMPMHPAVNPPHRTMAAPEPAPLMSEPPLFSQPAPLTNDVVPASLLPKVEELLANVPAPSPPSAALGVYLPLLWINQAFDGCTLMLGESGANLRSQAGRMLLALMGVTLFLGSVTWFLKDWLGWQW
jgi:hypothetical protein